jgi:ribosomal protein S18 acetylase RimI-like enzyme
VSAAAPRPPGTIVARLIPSDPATLVRPLAPADEPFCRALFHADRGARLAPLGDDDLVRTLLDQQLRAQQISYARAFPDAEHAVIEHAGAAVGRLIVVLSRGAPPRAASDQNASGTICSDEIASAPPASCGHAVHLVDIVLAEAARGCGIGTDVICSLARAALAMGATRLTLSVLQTNDRARRLYEQLGFVAVAAGSHVAMVKPLR